MTRPDANLWDSDALVALMKQESARVAALVVQKPTEQQVQSQPEPRITVTQEG